MIHWFRGLFLLTLAVILVNIHCLYFLFQLDGNHRKVTFISRFKCRVGSIKTHYFRTAVVTCSCGKVFYYDARLLKTKDEYHSD
jgi:hypothetical protein